MQNVAVYESVLLYAHATTKVLREGGDLRNGQAVTRAVQNMRFAGVGGRTVAFNERGARIQSYEVTNYVVQRDGRVGSVVVGMFNALKHLYTESERAVVWPGICCMLLRSMGVRIACVCDFMTTADPANLCRSWIEQCIDSASYLESCNLIIIADSSEKDFHKQ